jgi:hypothetical protein
VPKRGTWRHRLSEAWSPPPGSDPWTWRRERPCVGSGRRRRRRHFGTGRRHPHPSSRSRLSRPGTMPRSPSRVYPYRPCRSFAVAALHRPEQPTPGTDPLASRRHPRRFPRNNCSATAPTTPRVRSSRCTKWTDMTTRPYRCAAPARTSTRAPPQGWRRRPRARRGPPTWRHRLWIELKCTQGGEVLFGPGLA